MSGDALVVNAALESAAAVPAPGQDGGRFCPGDDVQDVPPLGAGAIHLYEDAGVVGVLTHAPDSPHVLPTAGLMGLYQAAVFSTHPVAASESWLAVGRAGDSNFRGAVDVFRRIDSSTDLSRRALWLSRGEEDGDLFGLSVALDGNTLVVGAPRADGAVDEGGSAFVYQLGPSGVVDVARLEPPGLTADGAFGYAIALSKEWIVVSAPLRGEKSPGMAYAFRRDEIPLGGIAHPIPAPGGAQFFGAAMVLDGEWLAIGAPGDHHGTPMLGSAHLFRATPRGWELVKTMVGGGEGGMLFGWSLAFLPGALLVGYPGASHGRSDDVEGYLGSVHVYERNAAGVGETPCILRAPNPDPCDGFGMSIAVANQFVAIGAPLEDGARGGRGAPDLANGLRNAGAVYSYPRLAPPP